MNKENFAHTNSLSQVNATVETAVTKASKFKKFFVFVGPAYLVSVGYMDPGNWATDLQGGAKFGYQLIWVLLMSNLMALLLQSLSARLGIVRRKDLAQVNREVYPPVVNFCLYLLAEIAIAACDLAEVLGMALGIHLLFPAIPLLAGVGITVLDTFLLLWLQQFGIRKLEAFIFLLVLTIGGCFLFEIIFAQPNLVQVSKGFIPTGLSPDALFIAVGIIGATVMPHNLYLHSALVQTRKIGSDTESIKKALKFNFIDSTIALNAAFLVNAAILILAATAFHNTGNSEIAKIEDAHHLMDGLLGTKWAPVLFAVALLASGQSSTVTGTLAGQIVMEGYLQLRINPWLRRLLTRVIAIVPAVIFIVIYGEDKLDNLLIFSQVILSLQLGFAVIPLIHFVSNKKSMGEFAIKPLTQIVAWIIAATLISLNIKMVTEQVMPYFNNENSLYIKLLIIISFLIFIWLFIATIVHPIIKNKKSNNLTKIHAQPRQLTSLSAPQISTIAIALDFSVGDEKIIANALKQGGFDAIYILIHIVESASAKYLGPETDDEESRLDIERLETYKNQLTEKGYKVEYRLGYRNRIKEIVRLVKEANAEMLVMGAHKHTGLKDYLFGETINSVRHKLNISVLIIS